MKQNNLKIVMVLALILLMVQSAFCSGVIISGNANINRKAEEAANGSKVIGAGVARSTEDTVLENEKRNFEASSYTGFYKDSNGLWMIRNDGEFVKKDWYYHDNGKVYHTNNRGYLQYGLVKVRETGEKGDWFLFDPTQGTPGESNFGALITTPTAKIEYNGIQVDLQISQGGEKQVGAILNAREVAKILTGGAYESLDYIIPEAVIYINPNQVQGMNVPVDAQALQAQQMQQAQQAQQTQAQTNLSAADQLKQTQIAQLQGMIADLQAQIHQLELQIFALQNTK